MLRHSCPLFSDMSWYKGSLCYDIVVPPFLICHGIKDIYICYDIVVPPFSDMAWHTGSLCYDIVVLPFLICRGIKDLYLTI
jgi:cytochrome c oxidase subunit IV